MDVKSIMVAGYACGGTSCVAGMLHNAGVDMGQTAQIEGETYYDGWVSYPENPKAQYEDDPSVVLSWQILRGHWYYPIIPAALTPEQQVLMYEMIVRRCESPLWGLKAPSLAFTGAFFMAAMHQNTDTCLLVVHRDEYVVANHLEKRFRTFGVKPLGALAHVGEVSRALSRLASVAAGHKIPVYSVHYEDIVDNPKGVVTNLLKMVLPDRTPEQIQKAIDFVDPSLNHADDLTIKGGKDV